MFFRRVVHRGWILLVGVVGGILGLVNELGGARVDVPGWLGLAIFAAAVLIAFFWAFHDYRLEQEAELAARDQRIGALETAERRREDSAQRRLLVESELSVVASEHGLLAHPDLNWTEDKRKAALDELLMAASAFIEAVQGPAAHDRFFWAGAEELRTEVVAVAVELDPERLPSEEAIQAAVAARRKSCGLYPRSEDEIVMPAPRKS